MAFIRSISGLRATEDSLTPDIITKYMLSFENILPEGNFVLGRDGRPSGKFIEEIILKALSRSGRKIYQLGIVPTPTVQLFVELLGASGGIAITASHNPSEWNGLKFINCQGLFLDSQENNLLWEIVDNEKFIEKTRGKVDIKVINFAFDGHIDIVLYLPIFTKSKHPLSIFDKHYKVVVDAVNASGSVAIPRLLDKLGCNVIPLFCDGSGNFPHFPEPLPINLIELAQAVKKHKADLGIAVDPDSDRLVLIDENGEAIGEEKTIVLAIESVLQSFHLFDYKEPVVVVNQSTTRLVEDICAKYSAKVLRSPVGEINVVKKMISSSAVIGGEGSGGVILPDCHYGRDSLVGTALVLNLMATNDKSLSEIVSTYPKYEMIKTKFPFSGNLKDYEASIRAAFQNEEFNDEDGLKIIREKSWVQVRQSNTEPIIRIIAEAPTNHEADELIMRIEKVIKGS
jgi:phosphomannomutase